MHYATRVYVYGANTFDLRKRLSYNIVQNINYLISSWMRMKRTPITRCLSVLDFLNVNLGVYYKLEKKSISKQTRFFVEFELDFYCLCSLQKSILKSNWFFNFLNSIFWNWKKIEWHSIFQKSSGDRQGVKLLL